MPDPSTSAPSCVRRTPSLFFLLLLVSLLVRPSSSDPASLRRPSPMILPLTLSYANSSRPSMEGIFRRQLKNENHQPPPNARMRLYDDLLTNGYYTARLLIGTPPQEFALIVDSGSTVTYVPCDTCVQCGRHQYSMIRREQMGNDVQVGPQNIKTVAPPVHLIKVMLIEMFGGLGSPDKFWLSCSKFQPDLSTTYHPVKCSVDCTCDRDNNQCIYERQYAEMSSSSGVLGEDVVSFGKESALGPQRAVFGCENVETGELFSQHADGIMGLGRGQLSIMDQFVDKGVISDSFSLCYGGMGVGGGAMVLGGISPPQDMVFARSDPVRSPYYNIELKEIHVAGKALPLNPRIFDSKHGTVMDSGTTYAYLPEEAFSAFKAAVAKKLHSLKQIRGPDPTYNDICFSGAGRTWESDDLYLDELVFLLENTSILRKQDINRIIVRNTLVTYDRENERIGFWKTNCSELWERLHIPMAPSPAPAVTYSTNSAIAVPPAMSPSEFQVGVITFDMSLSANYSDLMPQITELKNYIAQELGVNASQVKLLNATSIRNGSLIEWAILPAESSHYISNSTAMNIISRLAENRVHLPDTFGTSQVVKWDVEPPAKRTWWQRHVAGAVVGTILVAMLILSTLTLWYIWRRRQLAFGRYKPVDGSVAEQELQQI
ncbi:hypothetical protein ACLOJK_003690 [Asimina triloba]